MVKNDILELITFELENQTDLILTESKFYSPNWPNNICIQIEIDFNDDTKIQKMMRSRHILKFGPPLQDISIEVRNAIDKRLIRLAKKCDIRDPNIIAQSQFDNTNPYRYRFYLSGKI